MANTVSCVLSLENTMSTVTNFVSITFFRIMGVDLATYMARIGCFGGGRRALLNSTNVSSIHRIFVTLPKFIEKLQSQGLSNHYVLIISRLKGFPVLYEDAVANLIEELGIFDLASANAELLLLLEILNNPFKQNHTKERHANTDTIYHAVPIFKGRDIGYLDSAGPPQSSKPYL